MDFNYNYVLKKHDYIKTMQKLKFYRKFKIKKYDYKFYEKL